MFFKLGPQGSLALGGRGGVSFMAQLAGTALGIVIAVIGGLVVYGALRATLGLRGALGDGALAEETRGNARAALLLVSQRQSDRHCA